MGYQLGVDLGTTYTAAALYRDGRVEVVSLGDRSTVMPSVAFVRPDGDVLVGAAANRRGVLEPERVAREFKRRVGDPTPLVVGGSPYPPEALMARLLRAVVAEVAEREGAYPDGLALTHPANWGDYKLDYLRQAVAHAEIACPVTYLSEPEAAAMHYAASERVPAGTVVAVYDLGGGTFDAAVLRRSEAGGFEVAGQPQGIERLGGVDFDAAIFAHVDQALAGAVSKLQWDDEVALQAVARLRTECVEAKEALTRDTDVVIPAVLPDRNHAVRLTRAEFEAMIRPALGETITALRRALASAGLTPEDVHAVLLVGGSSRIPLVAQLVSSELGRPIAVDAHPKHAIAQGAAIAAAEAAEATTPEAVTVAERAETAAPPIPAPPIPAPPIAAEPIAAAPIGSDQPPVPPAAPIPPPGALPGALPTPPPGALPTPPPGPPAPSRPNALASGRARIALVGVAVLLVAAVVALTTLSGGDGGGENGTSGEQASADDPPEPHVPDPPSPDVSPAPEESVPPSGGTPPSSTNTETQALITGCAGDAVDDCDRLYNASSGDAETAFAQTCGNRLDSEDANGDCIITYDAIPTDDDPEIHALIDSCAGGAMDDCDRLYDGPSGPANVYGQTCGHRLDSADANGDCVTRFDAIPSDDDPDTRTLIEGCSTDAVDDCDRLYDNATGPAHSYAQTCGHRLDSEDANGDCIIRFDAIPGDNDPDTQELIEGCSTDAIDDCDRLYDNATGPAHTYAQTCGHRLEAEDARGDCIITFEVVPTDDDPEVQGLIDGCREAVGDCDRLYDVATGPAHTYAQTCGHRLEAEDASGDCATLVDSAE